MSAATSSAAMPSASLKPVSRMVAPAMAVATNAARSVRMCWKAPSTLSDWRFARERIDVAARFTAMPTTATIRTGAPSTSGGSSTRRTPS